MVIKLLELFIRTNFKKRFKQPLEVRKNVREHKCIFNVKIMKVDLIIELVKKM